MIVAALVILLVVLVIANFGLGIFNRMSPPCNDAYEYFNAGRMLPDGVTAGLGSIQSGTDMNYVGAARFDTGVPGTIGLKSYNATYVDPNKSYAEGYINTSLKEVMDDEEHDAKQAQKQSKKAGKSEISTAAYDAISAMFRASSQSNTLDAKDKQVTDTGKSLSEFEVTMEGIAAKTHKPNQNVTAAHRNLVHQTLRDGYEDN